MRQDSSRCSAPESYRVIAVEDGFFKFEWKRDRARRKTFISVLLWEGKDPLDVKLKRVTIDGMDATRAFIEAVEELECGRVDAVLLGGITFAGFNIIDPIHVRSSLGSPVIVVTKARPDDLKVRATLEKHFEDWRVRWRILEEFRRESKVYRLDVGVSTLYIQPLGISLGEAERLIKSLTLKGSTPEPLRLAKIIASTASRAIIELLEPRGKDYPTFRPGKHSRPSK